MWTWLRRMFWLSLACGAGYAAYTAWQRRREPVPQGPPEWPPLTETNRAAGDRPESDAPSEPHAATGQPGARAPEGGWSTSASSSSASDAARWVEPVDGACPSGFPIKAKESSGIYHVPGGRSYDRTVPERCYAEEADAQADGYRRAKA